MAFGHVSVKPAGNFENSSGIGHKSVNEVVTSSNVKINTTGQRIEFHPKRKLPFYVNGIGKTNALTLKEFFRGSLINKFRIVALAQWGTVAVVGLVWAQHGHGEFWERVLAPKK